jgi:CheY-like chemotaxis protein
LRLTGYGRPEEREQALAAGFELLLVKPVDPPTLRAILGGEQQPARASAQSTG